jgi:hypothetical protein
MSSRTSGATHHVIPHERSECRDLLCLRWGYLRREDNGSRHSFAALTPAG